MEDFKGMAVQYRDVANMVLGWGENLSVGISLFRIAVECRVKAKLVSEGNFDWGEPGRPGDKLHNIPKLVEKANIPIKEETLVFLQDDITMNPYKVPSFTYSGTLVLTVKTDEELKTKIVKCKEICDEVWELTAPFIA